MVGAGRDERGEGRALRPGQLDLLAALETFFFRRGYRAATMTMLARELRCSKRQLYELAPGRKALFCLIVDRWACRVRLLGLQSEACEVEPRRKLIAYLEPGVSETSAMTEAFLIDLRDLPAARAILDRHQRERMARLRVIVEEGARTGAFKNFHAHLVANLCLACIERINDPEVLREAGLGFSESFAVLYQLLMTSLLAGGDEGPFMPLA